MVLFRPKHLEKLAEDFAKKGIPPLLGLKGKITLKVPKTLEITIEGCICGEDSNSWALLKKDGTFETTCPNCCRVYYEGTYTLKPYENKIEFEKINYNFKNKREDELSLIPHNGLKSEGEVNFRVIENNSVGYFKHVPIDENTLFRDSL